MHPGRAWRQGFWFKSWSTHGVVTPNIVFALGIKTLIMVLAFLGVTSIWFAIFADVGVALLAILNAVRALYVRF